MIASLTRVVGWVTLFGVVTAAVGLRFIASDRLGGIKAMADAAGMDVTIDPKPIQELIQQVLFDRNFEVAGFGMSIPDAEPWIRLGSFLGSESFVNSGRYDNPEMDAALEMLRSVADDEERLAVLAEIQEIWNETIPNIVYGASEELIAIDDSIKGIKTSQDTQIYFDTAFIE